MQLSELIIEVRSRAGLLERDQMADPTTLTQFINHALGAIEAASPTGWPWLRKPDVATALVFDQGAYPFAALSGADIWRKIRAVRIAYGTEWQPLEVMNDAAMREAYPSTLPGQPQAWSTDGYNLLIRPLPNDATPIQLDVIVGEPDLVNPTDEPLLTDIFSDVCIDQAVYLLKRRVGDSQGAQVALSAYNDGIKGMRALARATRSGPGKVRLREPWL